MSVSSNTPVVEMLFLNDANIKARLLAPAVFANIRAAASCHILSSIGSVISRQPSRRCISPDNSRST